VGENRKRELKFRCLKKEAKERYVADGISEQTKRAKCFLTRKLEFLTAQQHFGHGLVESKTAYLILGSSISLIWYFSTKLSPVNAITLNVLLVVVKMIKNLLGLESEQQKMNLLPDTAR
jgi:hypothetical protein